MGVIVVLKCTRKRRAGFHLPFGTQDFQHFVAHGDTVGIPPTQCFLNEAPDLLSNAALLSGLCNVA